MRKTRQRMRSLTIRLPHEAEAKLEVLARREKRTRSDIVREAIERYEGARPVTVGELAGPYCGIEKGGPRDVSYNPRYMRDFGR